MVTFLAILYILICEGFILGLLMDNDEFSRAIKITAILLAIIIAPIFVGIAIERILIAAAQPK